MISSDCFTVYRRETAGKPGEYGSLKIVSFVPLRGQADSVNVRLKIKSDYRYHEGSEAVLDFLKGSHFSYDNKVETGSVSTDDIMRAAYGTDSTAAYYKALDESGTSFEITVPDGEYYSLRDSESNRYLVQILPGGSVVPKVQVPAEVEFPDGESVLGQIEFVFDENGIGCAVNFVPGYNKIEFSAGIHPISGKVFDGASIKLMLNAGSISGGTFHYRISPEIKLTDDVSRGITLEKTPISGIPGILEYEFEYYIYDIYGNEMILAIGDDTPVLRNIANAEITGEGVKYGNETLREGQDYEKYGFGGGSVYFGIGSYTGHCMIQD